MEQEVWKDVVGYEGFYMVSNLGRVKSVDRVVLGRGGFAWRIKGKMIKCRTTKHGYCQSLLTKNNRTKAFLVHRLMMLAFVPNPNNYPIINHKDENPSNNYIHVNSDGSIDFGKSNLEWCTYSYNINYGTRHERYRETCKRNHSTEKFLKTMKERGRLCAEREVLCLDDNMEIVSAFKSVAEAARQIHVGSTTIRNIMYKNKKQGTKRKSYGYLWIYKDDFNQLNK